MPPPRGSGCIGWTPTPGSAVLRTAPPGVTHGAVSPRLEKFDHGHTKRFEGADAYNPNGRMIDQIENSKVKKIVKNEKEIQGQQLAHLVSEKSF